MPNKAVIQKTQEQPKKKEEAAKVPANVKKEEPAKVPASVKKEEPAEEVPASV